MGNADVVTDKKMFFGGSRINYKINFNKASIKEIMGLEDVDKETANDIYNFARDTTITDNYDLLELESIDINMLNNWNLLIDDMRVNINYINEDDLKKVKGVGNKKKKNLEHLQALIN